ncbi:hypothetical protein AD946_04360 [Gluconobacter thailandicus]|nr:hypothetical protein AD946_04360 [Gluconobacter thailandicus]
MEVHFYTSVHLSSRVGGGLMLRLVMSPDTASPLHFATELLGGGYLIFERMSDAAVGMGCGLAGRVVATRLRTMTTRGRSRSRLLIRSRSIRRLWLPRRF